MTLLLSLIQHSGRSSPILEDAFLCVGAMASVLDTNFAPYLGSFLPFLSSALANHEEYTLCAIGVGLIGDICRALGEGSAPYARDFMQALMSNLSSEVLHRSVKPPILSCFGDIALAVGETNFEPFLDATMNVLAQAGSMRADPTNYDIVEYVNTLREGILEAYTGIVGTYKQTAKCESLVALAFLLVAHSKGRGSEMLFGSERGVTLTLSYSPLVDASRCRLSGCRPTFCVPATTAIPAPILLPYVPSIFAFLHLALTDPDRTEGIVKSSVGLIGDLASEYPKGEIREVLTSDWVAEAIKSARTRIGNQDTKNVAKWAKEVGICMQRGENRNKTETEGGMEGSEGERCAICCLGENPTNGS